MVKTPEEIKKGLECCTAPINDCDSCPYLEYEWCEEKLKDDLLELYDNLFDDRKERDELADECQQLESRLAQVERERDAAVEDMRMAFRKCNVCCTCKYEDGESNDCMDCIGTCNWQWRGPCPENTPSSRLPHGFEQVLNRCKTSKNGVQSGEKDEKPVPRVFRVELQPVTYSSRYIVVGEKKEE